MRWLWPVLLLAACAKEAPPPPIQGDVPGLLRNPTAPLASQVDVTAERLKGEWFVREGSGLDGILFSNLLRIEATDRGGLVLYGTAPPCDQRILCDSVPQVIALQPLGPGRWSIASASLGSFEGEVWVHWLDFNDRTAAIGTPQGKFLWIMDRGSTGGADRISAARDILEWYGYDLSQMESLQ